MSLDKLYEGYPKTKAEWWDAVDKFKEELLYLIDMYHPGKLRKFDHQITAASAEAACEKVRNHIRKDGIVNAYEIAEKYIEDKNDDLVTILNQTWFGMPESYEVRVEPGFGVLCDLCSESYVLEEE